MLVTDEAEHGWILGEWNQLSGRHAIFCDEGDSAWFYLTEPGPNGPGCPRVVASVFVCNLVSLPPKLTEVRAWAPGPPPAAEGFAGPDAYLPGLAADEWAVRWSHDGHSGALTHAGRPVAMIVGPEHDLFSRNLVKAGGWGRPWSRAVFRDTFGDTR